MTWCRILFVTIVLAGMAPPAPAGLGILSLKPKANAAERVPELLIQLKTSRDEAQRAAAAEELRLYDPKTFPEIAGALVDALGRDAGATVRVEAAASLGKLRPISQKVGYALEQAVANDGSLRVRLAARQSLWQYHLVGYRSGRATEPEKGTSDKVTTPPGPSTPVVAMKQPIPAPQPGPGNVRETAEPPLADAPPITANKFSPTLPAPPVSRPQTNPGLLPLIPSGPPKMATPPVPPADGPILPPPG